LRIIRGGGVMKFKIIAGGNYSYLIRKEVSRYLIYWDYEIKRGEG
jgi:hypothetical protein